MPGMTILHYEFLEKIGSGGMGEVFKAQDKRLNRFVAIKALPYARSGDPERRKRFIQEAQSASSLSHPNIIIIHDIFQEGDTHFIVMEYVAGQTLLDLIPPTGMPVGQVLLHSAQMAEALSAAHEAGIIHRDFKPANVMVTSLGLVKVLDFGLAKLVQPEGAWMVGAAGGADESATLLIGDQVTRSSGPQTTEGSILGTVNYMSPEQAEGKRVDGRSDIFSLGAVMYEMLTGRRAFQGNSDIATLSAVLRDEVVPISALVRDVPREVEDLVNVCLRKNPNARWRNMKEVALLLTALKRHWDAGGLQETQTAPEPVAAATKNAPPAAASTKSAIGLKKILVLGAACVALLLAAAAAWWLSRPRPHATTQVAQQPANASQPPAAAVVPAPEQPATPAAASPDASAAASSAPAESLPATSVPVPPAAAKKDASALPQAPPESAPVVSAAPPARLPVPAPVAPSKPARPDPARVTAQQTVTVSLGDGVPFGIALAQDVTVHAQEHEPLTFRATEDVKAGDVVVIPKGAAVTGEVVNGNGKKFLGIGSRMTFKLDTAETMDGQKIPVRASVARRADGPTVRPVDTGKYAKPKELAAVSGTDYVAYIDGDHTITLRK